MIAVNTQDLAGKKEDKKIIMIAGNTGPGRARRKTRRSS